jgi:NADH-quinone oxidoreductase subunit L
MNIPIAIQLAALTLFGPLGVALLLALVPAIRTRGWPAIVLSICAASAALAAAVALLVVAEPDVPVILQQRWLPVSNTSLADVGLRVDGLSTAMLCVVTLVALAVQVFSVGYMHDEPAPAQGRYFAYHSLFIFSMNLLVLAPNLLQFFAGWELVGLTSYLLIGFYYRKPEAGHAAIKAFWVTKFADMGLALGLVILFVSGGQFAFDAQLPERTATATTLLLFLAVMGKSAQFPLHVWLPNAMEGPTPVSALLHAATMVAAGVYLLVRASPLFLQVPLTLDVMLWVGALTAVFGAFVAVFQTDIKRTLAYSTCSQLGYMVAAAGAGAPLAAQLHLTTHACFKALLFLGAGSVIHAVHSNDLRAMGGLGKKMPVTAVCFGIGALALAGVPGFSGFFSKDWILEALAEKESWVPLGCLLVASFMTAFYMTRVTVLAFAGEASNAAERAHEAPVSMLLPVSVLACGAVGAGWGASRIVARLGGHYEFHLGLVGTGASALAVAGVVLAWVAFGRGRGGIQSADWYRRCEAIAHSGAVDRSFDWAYRRGLLSGAAAIGWFDRYIIDGAMNWIAWFAMALGRRLQRIQSGNILDYVTAVVIGALAMAAWGMFS